YAPSAPPGRLIAERGRADDVTGKYGDDLPLFSTIPPRPASSRTTCRTASAGFVAPQFGHVCMTPSLRMVNGSPKVREDGGKPPLARNVSPCTCGQAHRRSGGPVPGMSPR